MTNKRNFLIALILIATSYMLIAIFRYWYSDILYTKAKQLNRKNDVQTALEKINKAIKFTPREPIYHLEAAESYLKLTLKGEDNKAKVIDESRTAVNLSPRNVNIKKVTFSNLIRLSSVDPKFLSVAIDVLNEAIKESPTDAKLFYNLGLTYARAGQKKLALENINKAIELKANYEDAKLAKSTIEELQ